MKERKGTYLFNDMKKKLEVPDAINYKLRRLYGISQIMQLKGKKKQNNSFCVGKDYKGFDVEHIRKTNPELFNHPKTFPFVMDEWTKWYSQYGVFGEEEPKDDDIEDDIENDSPPTYFSPNNPFKTLLNDEEDNR